MITPKGETEVSDELQQTTTEDAELDKIVSEIDTDIDEKENLRQNNDNVDFIKLTEEIQSNVTNGIIKSAEDFVNEERKELKQEEESTQVLLEEAIREESPQNKESDKESQIVKHESEQVQSIFLETEIPQQSRVLVTDFKDTPQPGKDSPLVVSGKITLSLIQDTRGTPDRDLESTQDDFTTASAATQPAEKDEELSDEEIEEEIEIEEIEEEVEEEEEEVEEEPKKTSVK